MQTLQPWVTSIDRASHPELHAAKRSSTAPSRASPIRGKYAPSKATRAALSTKGSAHRIRDRCCVFPPRCRCGTISRGHMGPMIGPCQRLPTFLSSPPPLPPFILLLHLFNLLTHISGLIGVHPRRYGLERGWILVHGPRSCPTTTRSSAVPIPCRPQHGLQKLSGSPSPSGAAS